MSGKSHEDSETPGEKFRNEIRAVFVRWIEEADIPEKNMRNLALYEVSFFFDTHLHFEPDPDFLEGLDDI